MNKKKWRSFVDGREFARSLGFKSCTEWDSYSKKGGSRPRDIPGSPQRAYKSEWISWRNWLTSTMNYEEAKDWMRVNGIRHMKEFVEKSNVGLIPRSIPKNPKRYYSKAGEWKGLEDFFPMARRHRFDASKNRSRRGYVSLEEARRMAIELGLKTGDEYRRAWKEKRLLNCPGDVSQWYKGNGWKSWGWFLKTGRVTVPAGSLLPFEDGRRLARQMTMDYGLNGEEDYRRKHREMARDEKLPSGLTIKPDYNYDEFRGWNDWLGLAPLQVRGKKSIDECARVIRGLGVRDIQEWNRRRGEVGSDVYVSLRVYRRAGYSRKALFGDQYGNKKRDPMFPPYDEAVVLARMLAFELGIKRASEWKLALGRGLPMTPNHAYEDKGWKGWDDWLGVWPKDFSVAPFDPSTVRHGRLVYRAREVVPESEEKWAEVWKLPGYGWDLGHMVSNFGRVFDRRLNKFKTGSDVYGKVNGKKHGKAVYLAINMKGNSKKGLVMIHRLVAAAFVPNPNGKPVVNHMDGNSKNNVSWNLEWVTSRENNYHAILTGLKPSYGLSEAKVYEIKLLLAKGHKVIDVARNQGISHHRLRPMNLGRTYRYIGKEGEFTYPLNGQACKFHTGTNKEKIVRLFRAGTSMGDLASKFGLCRATIYNICHAEDRNEACPQMKAGWTASAKNVVRRGFHGVSRLQQERPRRIILPAAWRSRERDDRAGGGWSDELARHGEWKLRGVGRGVRVESLSGAVAAQVVA